MSKLHEANTNEGNLYIICPTDNIEIIISGFFLGRNYFHSSIGVHFNLDLNSQIDIWDFIKSKGIKRLIFVISLQNIFFKNIWQKQFDSNSESNVVLQDIKDILIDDNTPFYHQKNLLMLSSQYVEKQIFRLFESDYLGNNIQNSDILVEGRVYNKNTNHFYSFDEIETTSQILGNISIN